MWPLSKFTSPFAMPAEFTICILPLRVSHLHANEPCQNRQSIQWWNNFCLDRSSPVRLNVIFFKVNGLFYDFFLFDEFFGFWRRGRAHWIFLISRSTSVELRATEGLFSPFVETDNRNGSVKFQAFINWSRYIFHLRRRRWRVQHYSLDQERLWKTWLPRRCGQFGSLETRLSFRQTPVITRPSV